MDLLNKDSLKKTAQNQTHVSTLTNANFQPWFEVS